MYHGMLSELLNSKYSTCRVLACTCVLHTLTNVWYFKSDNELVLHFCAIALEI